MTVLNKLLSVLRPTSAIGPAAFWLRPKSAIYVVNESTVVTDAEVKLWVKAVGVQIKRDVAPAWNGKNRSVRFISSPAGAPKNGWVIAVLDDADQAGALGYHSTDDQGRVYGRVFAKTAEDYGYSASQTFSHEVLETWGDPGVDEWVTIPGRTTSVPLELCDAVEGDSYAIMVSPGHNVEVSNFVYPEWFGKPGNPNRPVSLKYDYVGTTGAAFKLAPNGYTVIKKADGSTSQVFGREYDKDYHGAKTSEISRTSRRTS